MSFKFSKTPLEGLIYIESKVFLDERGYFMESFKQSDFIQAGIEYSFVQDNHSFSKSGVIRGMHYQKSPNEQGKLVSVISGEVFDVAVDLRPNSKTFGKWFAVTLSEKNAAMFWIPPGFAHGFQAIRDSQVHYKTTCEFSQKDDRGIRWDDPDIGINWPLDRRIVSKKDMSLPFLKELEILRGESL